MNTKNTYYQDHKIKIIEGNYTSKNYKIAIILPRFNSFINQYLLNGALDALIRIGNIKDDSINIIKIPGSYEIPIIANILSKSFKYHGIIALGTIIKGETKHFKIISSDIISKISNISIHNNIPITLGLLMTSNTEQAIQRAGVKFGNKGYTAALTVLEMINIIQTIKQQ